MELGVRASRMLSSFHGLHNSFFFLLFIHLVDGRHEPGIAEMPSHRTAGERASPFPDGRFLPDAVLMWLAGCARSGRLPAACAARLARFVVTTFRQALGRVAARRASRLRRRYGHSRADWSSDDWRVHLRTVVITLDTVSRRWQRQRCQSLRSGTRQIKWAERC